MVALLLVGLAVLVVGMLGLAGRMAGGLTGTRPRGGGASQGNPMLPHVTVTSNGQIPAAGATPFNMAPDPDAITAKAGPLTIQETGQLYIRITRPCRLVDAVCSTAAGATPANLHALSIFGGHLGNRGVNILSNMVQPGAAQRHPPNIVLTAGMDVYLQAYQLSGAGAEVTTWTLDFA